MFSSASSYTGGNLEPWGRVIPFIIGCAPAIVSPLWEVTDRDIDIYTQVCYFLHARSVGLKKRNESIRNFMVSSRINGRCINS